MKERHLSASQLGLLARCGEAYRRRYLEGEIIPPGIAAAKGKAFHNGVEMNMRQKLYTDRDLPASEIVERAVASFEHEVENVELTPVEKRKGKKKVVHESVGTVVEFAKAHARFQAPEYRPKYIEHRIDIPLDDRDLIGYIDLVDSNNRVIDFKTSGRRTPQSAVEESVQLTTYAAWHMANLVHPTTNEPMSIVPVRLDILTSTRQGVERIVHDSIRTRDDLVALSNRVDTALKLLRAGCFMPAEPSSWMCSPTWCGYWSTCPYISDRLKREAGFIQLEGKI